MLLFLRETRKHKKKKNIETASKYLTYAIEIHGIFEWLAIMRKQTVQAENFKTVNLTPASLQP